jgi:inhibitor of cysteine peptidase
MLKLKKNLNQKQKRSKLMQITKVLGLSLLCYNLSFAENLKVRLEPGAQNFSFSLPSNPTTGYHWSIQKYNHHLIQLDGSKYKSGNTGLIGSGGQEIFNFTVLNPKHRIDTSIILNYSRSWEKKPIQTQKVDIKTSSSFFNLFRW